MAETAMSEASVASQASIRVNGETEPLAAETLAALLADKAVDTEQKGIAVALNGSVVPRAAWPETALKAGDNVEIVRARQGG
jgi:sulfur carrier protein